ncbi:MAG: alpha/beta hydrolase [Pseudomonadota bacterium]
MNRIERSHAVLRPNTAASRPYSVLALHCSGADGTQWQHLANLLDPGTELILPDLSGPEIIARGFDMYSFSLADEAEPLIETLRSRAAPVHLVGHSFGGAVALHIARKHPGLVASLCLYEPTAFSLLGRSGSEGSRLFAEIERLTDAIEEALDEDDQALAAQIFTDFWGGAGAWQALRRDRKNAMARWVPKCPLDFGALLYEVPGVPLPPAMPFTLIVGETSHRHTRAVAELLLAEAPWAWSVEVQGAGHLGPFTCRNRVAETVALHLQRCANAVVHSARASG